MERIECLSTSRTSEEWTTSQFTITDDFFRPDRTSQYNFTSKYRAERKPHPLSW
jgi:hypothetical protein